MFIVFWRKLPIMKNYIVYIVLILLVQSKVVAQSSIDNILEEYNSKNALSKQTIDENKGHLFLFSRDDIERMHATRLEDIFKTMPSVYYHENRYALPDPMTSGSFEPYRSSYIRVYIDGVEVTQGWAGSGLLMYGNINIDFADHIEFYYMAPSYETSTEPAYLTIFIYSKETCRDEGANINLSQGSRGYGTQSVNYGGKYQDKSYMINLSHTNAKREKIDNGTDTPLKRNFEDIQLFGYIKDDTQSFHLQLLKKNTDSLAGASWDATPLKSKMDYLNLHMDYSLNFWQYYKFTISYDYFKTDFDQEDDYPLMYIIGKGHDKLKGDATTNTITTELSYSRDFENNYFLAGIKGRYKKLSDLNLDDEDVSTGIFNLERILSIFVQDQYILTSNSLLSFGMSYNYIKRNSQIPNDNLWQMRLGYIYSDESFKYKTYIYRTSFAIEPMSRSFLYYENDDIKPQTTFGITQEFGYKYQNQKLRLCLIYMHDKYSLMQVGDLSSNQNTEYFISIFEYNYKYDVNNKMMLQVEYARYNEIYDLDKLDDFSVYLSLYNRFAKLDFYNGFVYRINSVDWKNYIDWTSTISYDINENLTITIKGDNILNKAKKTRLYRFDPTKSPVSDMEPLNISPIDRSFSINLEYTF